MQSYLSLRGSGGDGKTIAATPRQLESLIRLSEALAKVRLSRCVRSRALGRRGREEGGGVRVGPPSVPLYTLTTPFPTHSPPPSSSSSSTLSVVERGDVDEAMRLMAEATLKAATDPETGACCRAFFSTNVLPPVTLPSISLIE